MHSREHIFKRKSKTKRKHPEIWDSAPSLPLALWRPPGHHLLAFPLGCRVHCRAWASPAFRLHSDSEVWCCTTEIFNCLELGNNGQEKSLSWAVWCMGETHAENAIKCLSTTLCKWKSCWCNQGHSWRLLAWEGFCWSVLSTGMNGCWNYYPESWVLPALGSNVL